MWNLRVKRYRWMAVVQITRMSVKTYISIVSGNEGGIKGLSTHGGEKERDKGGIVASADTVVDPLTMMIAVVYAIIALLKTKVA